MSDILNPPPPSHANDDASLDKFFYQNETVNLDNCDREPIHYIGKVQAGTALLLVSAPSQRLIAYSANLDAWLRARGDLSDDLYSLYPALAREVAQLAAEVKCHHELMESTLALAGITYHCVFHQHRNYYAVECFPETEFNLADFRAKANSMRRSCGQIMAAEDFQQALNLTAQEAHRQCGFARVKIYQFQHDWSGKVVAEHRAEHMPSFLGLYFPSSDIPKQARHLMSLVPYRGVATSAANQEVDLMTPNDPATEQPLDLSLSLVRGVSPIHLEYLRNMGVEATFSVSLKKAGKLWGLIACHHDAPLMLPFDQWETMNTLGTVLMSKLAQTEAVADRAMMQQLRKIEEQVANVIRVKGSIEDSLAHIMPQLRGFLRADGFAFKYGTHLHTEGEVLPEHILVELLSWADARADENGSFHSNALGEEWASAKPYSQQCCGVLVEPVQLHRICHLVWFRRPITTSVTWAGRLEAKQSHVDAEGKPILLPRRSFALWTEENAARSLPWTPIEIHAARELLKNMLDILVSQIELGRINRDMEMFSFSAAHDLKAPLRHINFALEMMQSISGPGKEEQMQTLLGQAATSYERLKNIIDGMMQLLEFEHTEPQLESVDANLVLKQALASLQQELSDSGAELRCAPLPKVLASRSLLTTVLVNLVSNAIKYRSPERRFQLHFHAEERVGAVDILVADNGLGIVRKDADKVFKPFSRLHRYDDIPGSGLGLSICSRAMAAMRGAIGLDVNYPGPGSRFVLTLGVSVHA